MGTSGKAGDGSRTGDAGSNAAGAAHETPVDKNDTTKSWTEKVFASGNIKCVLKTGITIALVITGIMFLPAMIVKALGNALFGWLPEWARPLALALCCCCCCCSCCSAVGLGIYMSVSHQ